MVQQAFVIYEKKCSKFKNMRVTSTTDPKITAIFVQRTIFCPLDGRYEEVRLLFTLVMFRKRKKTLELKSVLAISKCSK